MVKHAHDNVRALDAFEESKDDDYQQSLNDSQQ